MQEQEEQEEQEIASWLQPFETCKSFLLKQLSNLKNDYTKSLKEDLFDITQLGPPNKIHKTLHSDAVKEKKINWKQAINKQANHAIHKEVSKFSEYKAGIKVSKNKINAYAHNVEKEEKVILNKGKVNPEKKKLIETQALKLKQDQELSQKVQEKEAKLGDHFNKQGFEI